MTRTAALVLVSLAVLLAACAPSTPVCPPGSTRYMDASAPAPADLPQPSGLSTVDLGGETIQVDRILTGPVCNVTLSGTIYVACDIQVKKWEGKPNFLSGCDFQVKPGTVIYVAAHNNAAYYNGCVSCHAAQSGNP